MIGGKGLFFGFCLRADAEAAFVWFGLVWSPPFFFDGRDWVRTVSGICPVRDATMGWDGVGWDGMGWDGVRDGRCVHALLAVLSGRLAGWLRV